MRARVASAVAAVLLAAFGLAIGLTVADLGAAASSGGFVYSGVATKIVDGDTLDVRLTSGKRERVRLIGIDTPERGDCYFSQAGDRARLLALNRRVKVRGDSTQATRDRYGRLLAYVEVAGRTDLGATLIREGYGQVYVYSRPFARLSSYRSAQTAAKSGSRGLWRACATNPPVAPAPTPPPTSTTPTTIVPVVPVIPVPSVPTTTTAAPPPAPSGGCSPSYPGVCIPPPPPDLDCGQISFRRFVVLPPDPHGFDGDKDGIGCES